MRIFLCFVIFAIGNVDNSLHYSFKKYLSLKASIHAFSSLKVKENSNLMKFTTIKKSVSDKMTKAHGYLASSNTQKKTTVIESSIKNVTNKNYNKYRYALTIVLPIVWTLIFFGIIIYTVRLFINKKQNNRNKMKILIFDEAPYNEMKTY